MTWKEPCRNAGLFLYAPERPYLPHRAAFIHFPINSPHNQLKAAREPHREPTGGKPLFYWMEKPPEAGFSCVNLCF